VTLRDATRTRLALRRVYVLAHAARRLARWAVDPALAAPARGTPEGPIAHAVRVPLARHGADPRLEAGKRHNVRLVATALHGVVVTPARPLSFWRAVGPATEERGFAWGMELRSGCAVPAVGGGVCVVSNALFTLAAELGWRILERHAHSIALGDPSALDATLFYPHVDLRVAPREGRAILDVAIRGDVLTVAARTDAPALRVELDRTQSQDAGVRVTRIQRRVFRGDALVEDAPLADDRQRLHDGALRTCLDCGQDACHARVELPGHAAEVSR